MFFATPIFIFFCKNRFSKKTKNVIATKTKNIHEAIVKLVTSSTSIVTYLLMIFSVSSLEIVATPKFSISLRRGSSLSTPILRTFSYPFGLATIFKLKSPSFFMVYAVIIKDLSVRSAFLSSTSLKLSGSESVGMIVRFLKSFANLSDMAVPLGRAIEAFIFETSFM